MTSSSTFAVPVGGQAFCESVFDRTKLLMSHHIWGGMMPGQLDRWVGNFDTDEERYFAACIIDNLIYRSKEQTKSLIEHWFYITVPSALTGQFSHAGEFLSTMREEWTDPLIRIVAAVQSSDPPGKSGDIVCREMRRSFGVDKKWTIRPHQIRAAIRKGVRHFLLVDDILGTGTQIVQLIHSEKLKTLVKAKSDTILYIPLVAHQEGIEYVQSHFPKLQIRCVETLTRAHGVFDRLSVAFTDGMNSPESAAAFYFELLRRKNLQILNEERKGFGGLELLYVFEHACPDNTLPLLWSKSNGWKELFSR